jgi:ATP-dependent DNA ligase
MRRIVGGVVVLLLALPALAADDKPKDKPQTPEEEYKALVKEQQDAMKAFQEAYQAAKTQEERNKVYQEKYPQPGKLAPKFLELAEKNPKDPVAADALVWVVTNTSPYAKDASRAKAIAALRKHADSDKVSQVCLSLSRSSDQESIDLLRAILEKNPKKEAQGLACLSLAQALKAKADQTAGSDAKAAENVRKESEQLFERAADKYADVKYGRGTVGDKAKGELFEVRFLAIGKPVPDIEGEDADGKKFKLSDYKGKVVMLDFWGHW